MHMLARTLAALMAAAMLAVPATAAAHGDRHHPVAGPSPISAEDFLAKAAASNQFEIVTGRLAQTNAESGAVKALGAEFVAHHTELLEKGAAVAAQLGITVPAGLPPQLQATVERLQGLTGKRFDRAWLRAQLAAHEQALRLALRGAIAGEEEAIRTLAQGALPVITHHYGQLIDLAGGTRHRHHHGGHRHHG